ncbi:MAG: putative nucleotidyltransferase with HDIG domain [Desulforhopalus sp.]|jgi:putative nucleotidyltransferase with HDIG domain
MKLDFSKFIHALSDTVDLVGVDELQHSKRVAYMATECMKTLGGTQSQQLKVFRGGLLHDCGVSSTKVHRCLVNDFEWTESDLHCQVGASRMRKFSPLSEYADIIRYHHTRWEDLQNVQIDEEVKLNANLIYLLDRVDALSGLECLDNRLSCHKNVSEKIKKFSGTYFKKELVDAFLETAKKEAFWITQERNYLTDYLQLHSVEFAEIPLDTEQLKDMACIFAQVVDAKSPYTAEHSFGVSRLSGYLGQRCQLEEQTCTKIEVAGLLHDLGKLQIPDEILEHDGGLSDEDLAVMRHHSYVTYMILSRIGGLEDITVWASDHHEKIDGSGYPFKKQGSELPLESRIIMVADIFQALAQDRPYRTSLSADNIVDILQADVGCGKLDKEIVQIIAADTDQCYRKAVSL